MNRFILILDRIVNLYMYYVGIACLLSWVPNINPDYPFFHFIFLTSGFYILPPFLGFLFAPILIMTLCALISAGLNKLFLKLNKNKKPQIIVLSPEEFFAKMEQEKLNEDTNKDKEENNDSN